MEFYDGGEMQLKFLELSDAEQLFALANSSRQYLREWVPWLDTTKTVGDTIRYILATHRQFQLNNGFQTGIWYNQQFVGVIGFVSIDWNNKSTSLGYWLGEKYQGHGIMTLACRTLISHAFEVMHLKRVVIRCAVENMKSRAIPERLGFKNEGTLRQVEWLYDYYVDHVVYGMLNSEWEVESV